MRVFNIIKLIGRLFQNAMTQRSKHDLSFYHEDDEIWYLDFPDLPFAHHNLAIVGGAEKLYNYWRMADRPFVLRSNKVPLSAKLGCFSVSSKDIIGRKADMNRY